MRTFLALSVLLVACNGQATPAAPAPPPTDSRPARAGTDQPQDEAKVAASFTCPMHPQVHQDAPGACPICGMNLVPESQGALPAHDHRALHGGQVGMYGNHHLEYLAANGEYRVWVTNANREPITTGVKGILKDGDATVALTADDAQGLLVGRGDGAGTRAVVVEVTADGVTFSLSFNPVPVGGAAADDDHDHDHDHAQ
ncbi:hypothetical protein L6R53_03340 [Myxococcota bacterium]|nr:hypothetical protein [Myxococcota bacterium]